MPNIVSESASVQAAILREQDTHNIKPSSANSAVSNEPTGAANPSKLPYQASHQVELLHLRAEIDALLQQLQSLKQQRLASDQVPEMEDSKLHALV